MNPTCAANEVQAGNMTTSITPIAGTFASQPCKSVRAVRRAHDLRRKVSGMRLRIALLALALVVRPSISYSTGSVCGAMPSFDETATKDERIKSLLERAMACVRERKPVQSIALFSEIIGLDPDNALAYMNRGSAYLQSGQFELGVSDYSHVIILKPSTFEAWYNRGTAFVAAHQYDPAIADLSEAIRLKPDMAHAYCNRAAAYMEKSDYEKALSDFAAGIKLDSDVLFCYFARADLYFRKDDYQSAANDLTEALRLNPAFGDALVKRGEAFEHLGEREKALADYQSALAIQPFQDAQEGVERLTPK